MAAAPAAISADPRPTAWGDALLAARCVVVDPIGLGGVSVRSAAGPVRDAWLARWRTSLPPGTRVRTVPLHVDDERLLGGLDLAASLRAGRPIAQVGLLAEIDDGFALLPMAERIDAGTAARIAAALERGVTGREAAGEATRTRFGVIALDESDEDEHIAGALAERIALSIDLRGVAWRDVDTASSSTSDAAAVAAARARLPHVTASDEAIAALCETARTLGIDSLRMPRFALCAARALAALDGREAVDADDAARAARLVYAARVTRIPATDEADPSEAAPRDDGDASPPPEAHEADREDEARDRDPHRDDDKDDAPADPPSARGAFDDVVLAAAVAAIPPGLLARLARDAAVRRAGGTMQRGAGALGRSRIRGAPAGVRRARPRSPERLGLVETLRAAAPWQRMRRAERPDGQADARPDARVHVRAEDLHVVRFAQRRPTTTVFVVDASGSSALHRLAEAKGAVELLLADCYVRRDQVAVLAFRGKAAQLLLPPTRSLVRARRSLAGLPGGGGTPLAHALDATRELVAGLHRRGDTVLVVLLTDGRANVARDGSGGRPQAEADALASARALSGCGANMLLIDTSPQPYPQAARLADAMGATYRALPHAGATQMSAVVSRSLRRAA